MFTDLPGRSVRPPRPDTKRLPSIEDDEFMKPVPKAPYLDRIPSFKDDTMTSGVERSQSPDTWGESSLSSMKPIGDQKAQILLSDSMEDLLDSNWAAKQTYYHHPSNMQQQPRVDFVEPDKRVRAPYGYPHRPDVVAPRKKPPYAYPRSTNALNKEEQALARAQQRRMRYSDSSDT